MRTLVVLAILVIASACSDRPLTPDEIRAAAVASDDLGVVDVRPTSYGLLTKVRCADRREHMEFDYRIWTRDFRAAQEVGDVGGFMRSIDDQMQMMCLCLRATRSGDVATSADWQPKCDALMAEQRRRVDAAK